MKALSCALRPADITISRASAERIRRELGRSPSGDIDTVITRMYRDES